MKTKSAAKKRFKLTANGHVKRHKRNHRHGLTVQNSKRRRRNRQGTLVDSTNEQRIARMLQG